MGTERTSVIPASEETFNKPGSYTPQQPPPSLIASLSLANRASISETRFSFSTKTPQHSLLGPSRHLWSDYTPPPRGLWPPDTPDPHPPEHTSDFFHISPVLYNLCISYNPSRIIPASPDVLLQIKGGCGRRSSSESLISNLELPPHQGFISITRCR